MCRGIGTTRQCARRGKHGICFHALVGLTRKLPVESGRVVTASTIANTVIFRWHVNGIPDERGVAGLDSLQADRRSPPFEVRVARIVSAHW
jgi:hypothetical protein